MITLKRKLDSVGFWNLQHQSTVCATFAATNFMVKIIGTHAWTMLETTLRGETQNNMKISACGNGRSENALLGK